LADRLPKQTNNVGPNQLLTKTWHPAAEPNQEQMTTDMDLQYPISGLIVLIGALVFLKVFDFLAAQSVRRLLEVGGARRADQFGGSPPPE
jgi:hypothetical protein